MFHLYQLCPQCETLVSIMPPTSLMYRFSKLLSFDPCSFQFILINEFMGTNFRLPRIILHMIILRKCLVLLHFVSVLFEFIGFDFLRIWGNFELNLWNWSKESSLWCPKIKTHMKSDQNQAQIVRKWCFLLWMIEIGGIIETNVSHWGHNWYKWNIRGITENHRKR